MKVKIGDIAPDFKLTNQEGVEVNLYDYIGEKIVVLFFYPKDNTPGCQKQACAFRDSYEIFQDQGAEVIGISSGNQDSHVDFSTRNNLPFDLLSDVEGGARKLFGVPKSLGILPGRVTYIIDTDGEILDVFESQFKFSGHVTNAIEVIKSHKNRLNIQ
tara:strand:+ start:61108 stop:61581 length:474 start_codon:yes stop_codon:yes gene_type:complete